MFKKKKSINGAEIRAEYRKLYPDANEMFPKKV